MPAVFSAGTSSYTKPNTRVKKDTVGITVLNFKYRKELKFYQRNYFEVLRNSIINYIKQGKTVTLFSFCEYEGDESAIDFLLGELSTNYLDKIKVERYRGKIDEFIKKYASMEYVLCSRFHSVVLSALFQQKVAILSYRNKINNVIKDLHLTKDLYNVTELNEIKEFDLEEYNKLNINNSIINQSQKQFEVLDRLIKQ